jgi:hypothetical protein
MSQAALDPENLGRDKALMEKVVASSKLAGNGLCLWRLIGTHLQRFKAEIGPLLCDAASWVANSKLVAYCYLQPAAATAVVLMLLLSFMHVRVHMCVRETVFFGPNSTYVQGCSKDYSHFSRAHILHAEQPPAAAVVNL